MVTTYGCKGCQGPLGPSACPLHGAAAANDIVCQVCGYRGPMSGHGSCGSDPLKLIAALRIRIEALEARVAFSGTPAVQAIMQEPTPSAVLANGHLKDALGAWKEYKRVMDELNKPNLGPGDLERRANSWRKLKKSMDALEQAAG